MRNFRKSINLGSALVHPVCGARRGTEAHPTRTCEKEDAMFGLSKREAAMPDTSRLSRPLYGENYMHQTDREDWDVMNRELFAEVIEGWPTNAIALISNTNLGNSDLRVPYMRL